LRSRAAWKLFWERLGSAPAGLPAASPGEERVGRIVGAAAAIFILLVGLWGIAGPFPEGHYASAAAIGTAAANMWRLHTIFPVAYNVDPGSATQTYYMHHPLGLFWTSALLIRVFGSASWVLRVLPALSTLLSTVFLYRLARALWGPLEAALGAVAFVAVPITIGYASYLDLEGPVILGCVVGTWGYVRLVQTWRPAFGWASVAGALWAIGHDWEPSLWMGFMVVLAGTWAYLTPPRWCRPIGQRLLGRWVALTFGATTLVLLLWLHLLIESNKLQELLSMFTTRSVGHEAPLESVLAARHVRIELMFPPPAIALGKLGLAAIVARWVLRRNHLELTPLPLLGMAVLQYTFFKNGADTHIFWPRPFTAYLPLAVGALAASIRQGTAWLAARAPVVWRRARTTAGGWLALALLGLPLASVLRDGVSLLRLARESGGRFIESNLDSFIEMSTALKWFLAPYPASERLGFHTAMYAPWSVQWEIGPRAVQTRQALTADPASGGSRLYVLDARQATAAELEGAVKRYHVRAARTYYFIDRSQPAAPLDGYAIVEREPRLFEWMFQGGVEPVRRIEPDPFTTWELRTAFGQPATPPAIAPITLDQVRIAHNVALAAGRAQEAAALRQRLLASLDVPVRASYDNGTKLLGARFHRGAERSLTLLFEAGKFTSQVKYAVYAAVTGRARLSSLPVDPSKLDIAWAPDLPTSLWKPGHLYALEVVYRKRAGHEVLTGQFVSGPRRTDGPAAVELMRF
jgi:4-amino-4-deoxy-L-arabinose transferase-like glycosyltransferase